MQLPPEKRPDAKFFIITQYGYILKKLQYFGASVTVLEERSPVVTVGVAAQLRPLGTAHLGTK